MELKMKRVLISAVVGYLSIRASAGFAYEPGTHGQMSDAAARNSVLVTPLPGTNTNVLQDLNLSTYTDTQQPLPDIQNGETVDLGPSGTDPFSPKVSDSIQNLIVAGAELEDESRLLIGRPLNHFYDPISGLPLNYMSLNVFHQSHFDAPDWAAQSTCAGISQTGLYSPSGYNFSDTNQCFSLQDGLSYFYNALTAPKAADRNQQFGNLFLTLGHVMHLVQDMAQPQHVRNDPHCDVWQCLLVGKYSPSRYETLTYDPIDAAINIRGFAGQYGTVSFSAGTARDFWTTGDGRGLAEYTNSNFFSAGSLGLYGGAGSSYAKPAANGQVSTETIQQVLKDLGRQSNSTIDTECPATAPCYVTFTGTTVHDSYKNSDTANPKAAALSLFSGDLTNKGGTETFSLNDATYEAAWNFLIPAAIDYSTGLLNYFFRGRLSMHPDASLPNGYVITNLSAYALSNGTLTVYYDAADGTRYPVQNATWSNVSMAKAGNDPADQFKIQITPPVDPAPANSGQYMVVFKGVISNDSQNGEPGIAALQYTPNTDVYFGQNIQWGGNFEYQADWEPNNAYEYAPDGTQVATHYLMQGELNAPWHMAVYSKNIYTADAGVEYGATVNEYTYPNYSAAARKVIAGGTAYYNQGGSLNEGIAVNDSYLLIPRVLQDHTISAFDYSVSVFDHSGNHVRDIPEPYLVDTISANDNHMCIALNEWDQHNIATLVELQDMSGNVTSNLMTIPATDSFFGVECASSRDRHYVLVQTIDYSTDVVSNQLYVYDETGTQIYTMPITGPITNAGSWQIATDGRNVYIAFDGTSAESQFGGIVVVNRLLTRDSGGNIVSETYRQAADIGDGQAAGGVAIDFANSN